MSQVNWDQFQPESMKKKVDYHEYMASRKWSYTKDTMRLRNPKCERCFCNDSKIIHHLTYKNVGYEKRQELMAVCRECHDFNHAKKGLDPLSNTSFFFAGKIKALAGDWRLPFFDNEFKDRYVSIKGTTFGFPYSSLPSMPVVNVSAKELNFKYSGPFYSDCHGGLDIGNGHGDYSKIVSACEFWVLRADALFAFIDDLTAFGSIAEIAFAHKADKPILLAYSSEDIAKEMNFITSMAKRATINNDPIDAFIDLCEGKPSNMIEGTKTFHIYEDYQLVVCNGSDYFEP